MDRVKAIINDREYQGNLQKIKQAEATRLYCKHDFNHALSVARLTYLLCLEQGITELRKPMIYAAGLLHDIGRWIEYSSGENHCIAGARLAVPILERYGFSPEEVEIIAAGIREHRHPKKSTLGKYLAQADDLSRDCFGCEAVGSCYKAEKMQALLQNLTL